MLKRTADRVEQAESLSTENEILRSQIAELETRVNTLSRAGDDARTDEKGRFEKLVSNLKEELKGAQERLRGLQGQLMHAEEEARLWKQACEQRNKELDAVHEDWKRHNQDFNKTVEELQRYQTENKRLQDQI